MIQIYDMTHREEWDEIVRSFSEYDVYYLSGYIRASRFMVMVILRCSIMRTMDSVACMCI